MTKAITLFERATRLDPSFAQAFAAIAMACIELGESGALRPGEAITRAKVAVEKALELDPDLS